MNRDEVANKLLEMANELSCYSDPFIKEHSEHLSAAVLFIRNDRKRIAILEAENAQLRARTVLDVR